ncbi:MAG: MotA/TolQ/ExbB proton channel family protein [Thermoguttaceae bacterium]|nr:MotA/TolQ/ExbB proton channel family protein [Thermoguttaceae bacterium]
MRFLFILLLTLSTSAIAQDAAADAAPAPVESFQQQTPAQAVQPEVQTQSTFWTIISAGGTIGLLIFALSIASLTLAIDQLRKLRKSAFMPEGLAQQTRELISQGQLLQADQLCRQSPCCLSYVINAGLTEADGDWTDIEKALEDSLAEQSAQCGRKIEILSVIGNIAPMLGLLGTVVGMVYAFSELANTQGTPKPAELAQGIYLALVTTVEGLIVAIPSLAAFAYFRSRLDQIITEVAFQAQYVFIPLKRQLRAGRRVGATIQAPPKKA